MICPFLILSLRITRSELICFDMRAFAVYLHKLTADSAQCHWQSIGCLKYIFSIAGLVIQSAACGLQTPERNTRETWKYVHVISRSWRLNTAGSPLFTIVMATIAIHRASKARWLHREAFVYFSAMQAQILLPRSCHNPEYLWAAPVCETLILTFSIRTVHFPRGWSDTLFALDRSAAEDVLYQHSPSRPKSASQRIPRLKVSLGLCNRPATNPILLMVRLMMDRASETW